MSEREQPRLTFGETVCDEEGTGPGTVRGFDEHGFYYWIED